MNAERDEYWCPRCNHILITKHCLMCGSKTIPVEKEGL